MVRGLSFVCRGNTNISNLTPLFFVFNLPPLFFDPIIFAIIFRLRSF